MPTNLIVNRNGVTYHLDVENTSAILDTDYILVNRDGVTYKAPGDMISKGGSTGAFGSALPPFTSESGPEMTLTNADGKIEFSLDGSSWSTSLNIPPETIYYCIWGSDILSAAHDSNYETLVSVNYPNLSMDQDVEIKLKIDKLPDPFSFTLQADVVGNELYTSNTVSPLQSINAPTALWGSSDAINPQIAIGSDDWEALPTSFNTRYVNMNERVRVRHTAGGQGDTEYSTTINIGYGQTSGEFETSTFTSKTINAFIDAPTITSPTENQNVNINNVSVVSAAATGVGFGTHNKTDWELANDSAFTDIVESSYDDETNLTTWETIDRGADDGERNFYIRCRYYGTGGQVSDWSAVRTTNAVKMYTWQVLVTSKGGGGDHKFDGGRGASGGGGTVTLQTTTPFLTAPGTVRTISNYASGGDTNVSQDISLGERGTGGNSAASYINGTIIMVSGGGGGGGNNRNDSSGTPGQTLTIGGNSGANNGGFGSGGAGGGAGGSPGAGGGTLGQGGGGFGLPLGTVIGNWEIQTNQSVGGNGARSIQGSSALELKQQYRSGSFVSVSSRSGNYNSSIAGI